MPATSSILGSVVKQIIVSGGGGGSTNLAPINAQLAAHASAINAQAASIAAVQATTSTLTTYNSSLEVAPDYTAAFEASL